MPSIESSIATLAVSDDADVIAKRRNLLHDMTREQDAAAVVFQLENQVAQRACRHDVETVGWLVKKDVLRVVHQRPRERDLGALSLRKALGAAVRKLADLQQLDDLVDAVVDLGLVEAAQPGEVSDVFARGQVRVQAGTVRQRANRSRARPGCR